MRVVFWQDAPSIHVAPTIKALCNLGADVKVVTEADTNADRRGLGWPAADNGSADVYIAPSPADRRRLEAEFGPDSHHVFHGLGTYPQTFESLHRVSAQSPSAGRICVFSEPWNPHGWRGPLRSVRYSIRSRKIPPAVDTLLVTGRLAVDQFRRKTRAGITLQPFAYAVEPTKGLTETSAEGILFVGKLETRKRVDLLLRAFATCGSATERLAIVGDGPQREALQALTQTLGIASRVEFVGAQSNIAARSRMSTARALVLPSMFDGWGAVVNEALHSGCYVIASDSCGASELLGGARGTVYDGSLRGLTNALSQLGDDSSQARLERASWAGEHIAPEVVARYLIEVLERPQNAWVAAPWLDHRCP